MRNDSPGVRFSPISILLRTRGGAVICKFLSTQLELRALNQLGESLSGDAAVPVSELTPERLTSFLPLRMPAV
jgi:hypothetical protein